MHYSIRNHYTKQIRGKKKLWVNWSLLKFITKHLSFIKVFIIYSMLELKYSKPSNLTVYV